VSTRRLSLFHSDDMLNDHVRRFGVPVCPHAGGVGLCEYVIHLRSVPTFR
jgi:hypothetical protein